MTTMYLGGGGGGGGGGKQQARSKFCNLQPVSNLENIRDLKHLYQNRSLTRVKT